MKKSILSVMSTVILLFSTLYYVEVEDTFSVNQKFHDARYAELRKTGQIKTAKQKPGDWFYIQRAYPNDQIPDKAYINAYNATKKFVANKNSTGLITTPWVEVGPTNIPGRIPCMDVHPTVPSIIYAGSAAGGVFKTVDFGQSWTPIFDEIPNLSIGAITLHPNNPNIIYVGTGEANAANDTYEGIGMYKSTDGGANWVNIGLTESYKIGRIAFDPRRPDTIFVAVQGKLFGTNPERGVYRSQNGGTTWEQVLAIDDTTGCIDIVIDSTTGTVIASMWTRYRGREYRTVGGMNSGIYRSTDGGENWTRLLVGLPAPADTVGRIGLAIEQTSGTLYSIFANHPGNFMGIYKSTDLGATWTTFVEPAFFGDIYNGFGWYFGQIRVAPGDEDRVFALGVSLYRTNTGGLSWSAISGIHADHHDLIIDPDDYANVYSATDGGVGYSTNYGDSYTAFHAMPSTQFYAVSINPNNSNAYYGGTQDNGSMRGTSTADNWVKIGGGDGFYTQVDPTDDGIIYAEYQWGQMYKFDYGSTYGITDWGFYSADRHNWNSPFIIDPQNNLKLYYGSNKLYQTLDGGDSWLQKSNDLTNGPGTGNLTYGTLTTIDVAPTDSTVVYVGTDDGNVWVTTDADNTGMFNWTNISGSLPNRWVTRVKVDPTDPAIVYVTLSGYKDDELIPHIYRSENYGTTWASVSGDLPDFPVNDIIVDPDNTSVLYIATDFGPFYSINLGVSWNPLGTGIPTVAIHDLDFNLLDRKLLAGTHGRSMYTLDLSNSLPCCVGIRGNIDGVDEIDIADLVYFVAYSFGSPQGPEPVCMDEADVDASGGLDIADIVYLVAYMFGSGPEPVLCG